MKLDAVEVCYGGISALHEVTIEVGQGEIVCLLGGNASGKSTVMKTVMGSLRPTRGRLLYEDRDISSWPISKRVNNGIAIDGNRNAYSYHLHNTVDCSSSGADGLGHTGFTRHRAHS